VRFRTSRGGMLDISAPAAAVLVGHRQLTPDALEAGGMLLGRHIKGTSDFVVDEATLPIMKDRRSRFSFFRIKKPAQNRVTEAWFESHGSCNYLGEWHTHPEDDPSPSGTDEGNWKRIVTKTRSEHTSLFFLIVGRTRIRVWEFERGTSAPAELTELA
jgi:integrative and conjugative element protein (TIGR02256 family)